MQHRKSILLASLAVLVSTILLFNSTPNSVSIRAGGVTPTLASYLPLILNPVATPTPTASPPDVRIITIVYNPAGSDVIGEYVLLQNAGSNTVTMTTWTLSDNNGQVYTFPSFSLSPNASVKVWTGSGANNATNLYQNRAWSIWTNTGDTAFLRDGSILIDFCSYVGGGVQASC